jgi:hypothetical protein
MRGKATAPPATAAAGPTASAPITVRGEQRSFLLDGDDVVLTGTAPGAAGGRISFGEVRGRIVPAL